ncbi:MAG: YncE family protein [Ignavibacteriaceae bacterium]
MKQMKSCLVIIFALAFLILPKNLYSQSSVYKVTGKILIGGETRWDYLSIDTVMHRLFIAHMSKVDVLDLNDGKLVGEIDNLNGVHGVVFAYEYGKGFISNGRDNSVTVFNLKTLKKIGNIKIPAKGPDAIVYDSFSKRVFTFNGDSKNATAIDAKTDKVIGNVDLDGSPEFAVSNNKGKMFVNLEDKSMIEEFDPATLKSVAKWSVDPCKSPSALAIDLKNGILFSGCRNKMTAIVDTKTGKLIATLPIGTGVDANAFDPVNKLVFSSCWDGTITVIKEYSPTNFKVIDTISTEKGARTMAFDKSTGKIYTVTMLQGKDNAKEFGVLILSK